MHTIFLRIEASLRPDAISFMRAVTTAKNVVSQDPKNPFVYRTFSILCNLIHSTIKFDTENNNSYCYIVTLH